jgi:predicted P-loop ATPase
MSDAAASVGGDTASNITALADIRQKASASVPDWMSMLQWKNPYEAHPTLANALVILRWHPDFQDRFAFNAFAKKVILVKQIPNAKHDPTIPRQLADLDVIAIQEQMQRLGVLKIAKSTVQDAIGSSASEHSFHPLLDYLNGLKWDGRPRLISENWLHTYLGAKNDPYTLMVGICFLVGMVARAYKPGCKSDHMLILEGRQRAMKSSVCSVLGGDWYGNHLPDLSGDDVRVSMYLRGKWLIEIPEMSSMGNAAIQRIKAFTTTETEVYVPKYGHNVVDEARTCLFIGTTNEHCYLKDATGGRRSWPVKTEEVRKINLEKLREDRDQLFAEAVALFKNDFQWWLDGEFETKYAELEQKERFEEDVWTDPIVTWLDTGVPAVNSLRQPVDHVPNEHMKIKVTVGEVLSEALNKRADTHSKIDSNRVVHVLTSLKWEMHKSGSKRWYWRPGHHKPNSGNSSLGVAAETEGKSPNPGQ